MVQKKPGLFRTIKKNLAIMGFRQNQKNLLLSVIQDHWPCYIKSILTLISLFAYLFFVSETVNEFMFSIFLSTATSIVTLDMTDTVFKKTALFKLLDDAESIFSISKC